MKLKWKNKKGIGIKDVKHGMCGVQFISPIKKAERNNNWSWWAMFVVLVVMVIMFILKVR
jgi:hypothetical protein